MDCPSPDPSPPQEERTFQNDLGHSKSSPHWGTCPSLPSPSTCHLCLLLSLFLLRRCQAKSWSYFSPLLPSSFASAEGIGKGVMQLDREASHLSWLSSGSSCGGACVCVPWYLSTTLNQESGMRNGVGVKVKAWN